MSNEIQSYGRRTTDYYSWVTTIRKGAIVFGVLLAAIIAVDMPQTVEEFEAGWKAYLFAVVVACIKTGQNWYKNADKPPASARPPDVLPCHWLPVFAALALCCVLAAGCVTSSYSKLATDPKTGVVTETKYGGTSAAWPFGKIDATAHKFSDYDASTKTTAHKEVAVGQDAKMVDNTGQIEALKAIMPLLQVLLQAALAPPVEAVTP